MASTRTNPLTEDLSAFVAGFAARDLPDPVREYTRVIVRDGIGVLLAAADPDFSTGRRIAALVRDLGGPARATVVGHDFRTAMPNAALANGTMGYACDFEPHHPEAVLHPVAVMVPAALAVAEAAGRSGADFLAAVALGCEVECRVSMALDPMQTFALGFHPSAVCGCFGATAAAGFLLGLDAEAMVRAFGLAACQASGMMAWESDPTENARPFQMGMAARNGITAALLAQGGFGGPTHVFDHGHTIFKAFSRKPKPALLTKDLGTAWDGIMELAVKPYPCVSELHPALDVLLPLIVEENLAADDIASITIHFARSIIHCIDGNPLKSHCAQYVLALAAAQRGLRVSDIFVDRRIGDPKVAELSHKVRVVADDDELERLFPDVYATRLEVTTRWGKTFALRNDRALGYPETPMSERQLIDKFTDVIATVASPERGAALLSCIAGLPAAAGVDELARLLGGPPGT